MARYKNMEIDPLLSGMVRHMDAVDEYRETLQNLQSVWDNLALLGQLSGTGADMGATREAFQGLTTTLLNQLGLELRAKALAEMRAKAQAAIDILVRNLFERTADIGFLATDDDIRAFLATQSDFEADGNAAAILRARFGEYRAKYSVYSDILLFDVHGQLLVRLDEQAPQGRSGAPFLAEALHGDAPYFERYGHFDFLPGADAALVYACRVCSAEGRALGVLCLAFRLDDEMARIFGKLATAEDHGVLLVLDQQGRVLASSDGFHVPAGARLPLLAPHDDCRALEFAGNDYLYACRPAHGFQGYAGPGWHGAVLQPLRHAFNKDNARLLDDVDAAALDAVLASASLFGAGLRAIPVQADRIQRDLNRSVWNGTVLQGAAQQSGNAAFSKVLLWEISKTGERTKDVFARSIANLHETVVSAVLQDSRFFAAQAIDIMDRNLYERANDCRWWALTGAFRTLLAAPAPDAAGRARMAEILAYINGLYTVYTNLVVFDREGCVQAVSQPQAAALVGTRLQEPWVSRALALRGAQGYVVSEFQPTPLYDGRPTYVYAAAIAAPDGSGNVGGIGIVFDSAPQFEGMLHDILPKDEYGAVRAGCMAAFADAQGRIVTALGAGLQGQAQLPAGLLQAPEAGAGSARIVALQGSYYAVGRQHSSGYREYKGEADAYRNAIDAYVFLPLGQAATVSGDGIAAAPRLASDRHGGSGKLEVAMLRIGETWYGLPTGDVVEAIERGTLVGVPGSLSAFAGYQMLHGEPLPVFDIAAAATPSTQAAHVVVLRRADGKRFGILADDLGDIPEVDLARQSVLPDIRWGRDVMTESVIAADPPRDMSLLQVLRAERIVEWLLLACPEVMAGEPDELTLQRIAA